MEISNNPLRNPSLRELEVKREVSEKIDEVHQENEKRSARLDESTKMRVDSNRKILQEELERDAQRKLEENNTSNGVAQFSSGYYGQSVDVSA